MANEKVERERGGERREARRKIKTGGQREINHSRVAPITRRPRDASALLVRLSSIVSVLPKRGTTPTLTLS